MRFFNTAGPVNCSKHYCLPPLTRFDLDGILALIRQEKYFVLHAPRQTGKTSCLLALMDYLNASREYHCVYVNVESAQAAREDVTGAITAILSELASGAFYYLDDAFLRKHSKDILNQSGAFAGLNEALTQWSHASPLPLVILIDEIDSLVGDTLISVLRQLRAGYGKRPDLFPQSVILCGVRDVRDYRIHSSMEKTVITGGSTFNIKAESLRLGNFSRDDVFALLTQHTDETGQVFEPDALNLVWGLTSGQPWLVNALAYEACFKMKAGRDRKRPISHAMIQAAKENIVLRRETHIDQLVDKLEEERVRRVIEPLLAGKELAGEYLKDDVQYVVDLGLIEQARNGEIWIANKIYQEVIPRELSWNIQSGMSVKSQWYVRPDGSLNLNKMLESFQEFFREHAEHWIERFDYKEAGPQLLLQAYLQRIVNSGGRIEREYGLGRMRTDLLIIWPLQEKVHKIVLELKVLRKSLDKTISDGLKQTMAYLERTGSDEGHLVIFDRDEARSWGEKIFQREESVSGRTIKIWGM